MPSRPQTNRRIVLAERPQRRASLSSFRLEAADVPELRPGELLEHAPAAFLGLLDGRNFGKLVVRVSDVRGAAR